MEHYDPDDVFARVHGPTLVLRVSPSIGVSLRVYFARLHPFSLPQMPSQITTFKSLFPRVPLLGHGTRPRGHLYSIAIV